MYSLVCVVFDSTLWAKVNVIDQQIWYWLDIFQQMLRYYICLNLGLFFCLLLNAGAVAKGLVDSHLPHAAFLLTSIQ